MTRGASRVFGDRGCLGDDVPVGFGVFWLSSFAWPCVWVFCSDSAISAFSSNAGPDMHDRMLSPNTCCRQLFPGALIERSCSGGRPGIVAVSF